MRYFMVGAKDDPRRFLVDTEQMKVFPVDAPDTIDMPSPLVKGVSVAIAAEDRSGLTSHQIWGG